MDSTKDLKSYKNDNFNHQFLSTDRPLNRRVPLSRYNSGSNTQPGQSALRSLTPPPTSSNLNGVFKNAQPNTRNGTEANSRLLSTQGDSHQYNTGIIYTSSRPTQQLNDCKNVLETMVEQLENAKKKRATNKLRMLGTYQNDVLQHTSTSNNIQNSRTEGKYNIRPPLKSKEDLPTEQTNYLLPENTSNRIRKNNETMAMELDMRKDTGSNTLSSNMVWQTTCVCSASAYMSRKQAMLETEKARLKDEKKALLEEQMAFGNEQKMMDTRQIELEKFSEKLNLTEQALEEAKANLGQRENSLKDNVARMDSKLREYNTMFENLMADQRKLKAYEREIGEKKRELDSRTQDIEMKEYRLEQTNQKYKEFQNSLEDNLKNIEKDKEKFSREYKEFINQQKLFENEKKEFDILIKKDKEHLENWKRDLQETQERISQREQTVNSSKLHLENKQKILSTKEKELSDEFERKQNQLKARYQQILDEQETFVQQHRLDVDTFKEERKNFENMRNELLQREKLLKEKTAELESETTKQLSILQTKSLELTEKETQLNLELMKVEDKLASAQAFQQTVAEEQNALRHQTDLFAEKCSEIQDSWKELKEFEAELEKQTTEYIKRQEIIDNQEKELEVARNTILVETNQIREAGEILRLREETVQNREEELCEKERLCAQYVAQIEELDFQKELMAMEKEAYEVHRNKLAYDYQGRMKEIDDRLKRLEKERADMVVKEKELTRREKDITLLEHESGRHNKPMLHNTTSVNNGANKTDNNQIIKNNEKKNLSIDHLNTEHNNNINNKTAVRSRRRANANSRDKSRGESISVTHSTTYSADVHNKDDKNSLLLNNTVNNTTGSKVIKKGTSLLKDKKNSSVSETKTSMNRQNSTDIPTPLNSNECETNDSRHRTKLLKKKTSTDTNLKRINPLPDNNKKTNSQINKNFPEETRRHVNLMSNHPRTSTSPILQHSPHKTHSPILRTTDMELKGHSKNHNNPFPPPPVVPSSSSADFTRDFTELYKRNFLSKSRPLGLSTETTEDKYNTLDNVDHEANVSSSSSRLHLEGLDGSLDQYLLRGNMGGSSNQISGRTTLDHQAQPSNDSNCGNTFQAPLNNDSLRLSLTRQADLSCPSAFSETANESCTLSGETNHHRSTVNPNVAECYSLSLEQLQPHSNQNQLKVEDDFVGVRTAHYTSEERHLSMGTQRYSWLMQQQQQRGIASRHNMKESIDDDLSLSVSVAPQNVASSSPSPSLTFHDSQSEMLIQRYSQANQPHTASGYRNCERTNKNDSVLVEEGRSDDDDDDEDYLCSCDEG